MSDVKVEPDSVFTPAGVPTFKCQGSGPLLVNISGLDGTGELFYKQTPALAEKYRVVSFRSRESGRFTYDDLTDDVAAIIRHLGEKKAIIVGESFGGTVALSFALRHPDKTERLVIINSFPRFRRRIRIKLAAHLATAIPFRATWLFRKAASSLGLKIDQVAEEDRRRFFDAVRTVTQEGYARRLRLISEVNLEDRLPQINVPTLLIAAEKDIVVPSPGEARLMASLIPNAQVKVIPDAGHACLLGGRVNLAEILSEWIGGQ